MPDPRPVLITGAAGFVGRVLVPALAKEGRPVLATSGRPAAHTVTLDVTCAADVRDIFRSERPEAVVHLAGMTYLPAVLEDQRASFAVNVLGTRNVLDAAAEETPDATILLISSCSVFGSPDPGDLPLREDAPLMAMHPYGVQKIGLEVLGDAYRQKGLDVRTVRPFNHIGPGLNPRLSLAHFAAQISEAERGERPLVLGVGNLAAKRDFTDVRDVVRAYLMILALDECPAVLHVASGTSIAIREMLDRMVERARVPLTIETDPDRLRPLDVPELSGDASLLHDLTGWAPQILLDETLELILADARNEDLGVAW